MSRLFGLPVRTDPCMCDRVQVRFPRSKRARIQRKWRKDPGNWVDIPRTHVYRVGGTLVMHPLQWDRMKRTMEAVLNPAISNPFAVYIA